jgi:release factor glutamine methyltransferase
MLIGELLQLGIAELEAVGVTEAVADACLLLGHCLSLSRTQLYLAGEQEASEDGAQCFFALLARRKLREPVAYILGEREFWSLPFAVTKDVLIPRPETEFLLETALKAATSSGLPDGLLLDLCCGSGVLATILALELQRKVIAADLSWEALHVARENAKRHGVGELVDFVQADLLEPFYSESDFSLIISNPPYVTQSEMDHDLDPEVIDHEPHLALNGGNEGLDIIKRIRKMLPSVLCQGGYFFMEIGAGQGDQVRKIFTDTEDKNSVFEQIRIFPDYAGRDRVLSAKYRKIVR